MEIRIILDPNEVRELLAKTGEVVIRPSVSNAPLTPATIEEADPYRTRQLFR